MAMSPSSYAAAAASLSSGDECGTHVQLEGGRAADGKSDARRSVGVLSLASLAFFAVAGSPAGSEDSISAGGALVALLGFVVMPILWSVPEAWVTAELATAFPTNGGFVVWVTEAFGDTAGYMEGLLKWLAGVLDNAVYPAMMLNYLRKVTTVLDGEIQGRVFITAVTLVLAGAQYIGLDCVGVTSNVTVVATILPFAVLVVFGIHTMDWERVVEVKPLDEISWGLLLQNLFWNLNYWDSVSTLASEVRDPARTFPRALALALSFTVLMYIFVLGVAVGNTPSGVSWDDAELADAGVWVAGPWLRDWIVVSISISCIGLFLAELSTDIYQLDGMAEMGLLPKCFAWKNRFDVPVFALTVQVSLVLLIIHVAPSVEDIIAFEMVSYCAAMILEFFAFVRLRATRPDIHRPVTVPGGVVGAVVLVTPGVAFTIAVMALSDWSVWVAGGVQIVFSLAFAAFCMWLRRTCPDFFVPGKASDLIRSAGGLKHTYDDSDDETVEALLLSSHPGSPKRPSLNGSGSP